MEENKDYRAYRYGDHLEPGAELKIEHSVSCEDVDISSLITMGAENLEAIPYKEMYRDGICRLTDKLYTKTVQFFDINYQLAQADDKAQIFEGYCDFLNYFDASIHVQLTFINQRANMQDFARSIDIPIRGEYGDMLKSQLQKGNNGLTKGFCSDAPG